MDNQQLLEYLRMVLDVEQTIYIRNTIINNLKEFTNNLLMPSKPTKPEKPKKIYINTPFKGNPKLPWYFYILLPVDVLSLLLFFYIFTNLNSGYSENLILLRFIYYLFSFILVGIPLLILIASITIWIYRIFKNLKKAKEENEIRYANELEEMKLKEEKNKSNQNNYQNSLNLYKKELIQYYKEMAQYKTQRRYLHDQISALERANINSENILNSLYKQKFNNEEIIYGKYQNLTAVGAFIEYLESGRCDSLKGVNGAYNKFDLEYKLDQIINNQLRQIVILYDINNSIKNIGSSLYSLDKSIKRINNQLSKIDSSINSSMNDLIKKQTQFIEDQAKLGNNLDQALEQQSQHLKQIKVNSDIASFNQERSRKELEYLRKMDDLEQGRWWNFN